MNIATKRRIQKTYSAKNKAKSAITLFKSRKAYKEDYAVGKGLCDLWHEDALYGRVDNDGMVVVPKKTYLLRIITSDKKAQIYAVNFVADAYKELQTKLKRHYKTGRIRQDSVFYSIEAQRAMTNLTKKFNSVNSTVHRLFLDKYVLKHAHVRKSISGFDQYLSHFITWIQENREMFCLTKTSVASSNLITAMDTGLAIEFSKDEKNDIDVKKVETYFSDPSYELYKQTCWRYGFMIDVNAPWRIVADLGSPYMQEMMAKRNFGSVSELHENAYERTYLKDYERFQNFMVYSYNQWVKDYGYSQTTRLDSNGNLKHSAVKRYPTTKDAETGEQQNERWIEAYIRLRNVECLRPWNETRVKTVIMKAKEINQYISLDKAMDYVNNELAAYQMTAHDFSSSDDSESMLPGIGNIASSTQGGSSGGSSGY
mgnify:CR=1 FL=1